MGLSDDKFFMAVRETDGKGWIDINTWGYCTLTARDKAEKIDKQIPQWAKANRVVRISRFRITEIMDGRS